MQLQDPAAFESAIREAVFASILIGAFAGAFSARFIDFAQDVWFQLHALRRWRRAQRRRLARMVHL